jgi:RimJ/RimL family protein N-acetyltransferase
MTARDAGRRIETPRLLLRPPVAGDLAALAALWAQPQVTAFISGAPSTREESWARLLRYIGHWEACGYGFFAITDKRTGAYLGECGFADFKREITPPLDAYVEAGWILDPASWGEGYASEAMEAAIGWHERRADAPALACIIAPGNAASLRLADKLGFRPGGEATYRGQSTRLLVRPRPDRQEAQA